MGENDVVEGTDESQVESNETTEGSESGGGNPNWDEMLSQIPDSFHHIITPHLTKWDQGVQQRFQTIQSQQEGYAPYKDLIEQGIDPQSIQQAMSVMGMINDNPDQFYKEMGTFYKDDPRFVQEKPEGQGQTEYDLSENEQQAQYNLESDPRFQQMMKQQDIMANFLSNQVQAKEDAAEDAALDTELKGYAEKYGEFDEDYVIGVAQSGNATLEQAVQRYKAMETKHRTAPTPGSNLPPVVTPGGGVPSSAVDPSSLDSKSTKNLVANYLASMNQ